VRLTPCFVGYVLTRDVERVAYFGGPLPPSLPTMSRCIAPAIPDFWCVSWTNERAEDRSEAAAALGLTDEARTALVPVVDRLFEEGALDFDFLRTEQAVRAILEIVGARPAHLRVLGVALPMDCADALVAEIGPGADAPFQALAAILAAHRAPPSVGAVLGYEPLCVDPLASPFHSWLCNGLVPLLAQRLGAVTNEHGLISDPETALALCRILNDEGLGEPGLWLPWLLIDCTAAFGGATVSRPCPRP
jgi:hypothetical protein